MNKRMDKLREITASLVTAAERHVKPDLTSRPTTGVGLNMFRNKLDLLKKKLAFVPLLQEESEACGSKRIRSQAEPYLPPFTQELLDQAKLVVEDACFLFNKVPHDSHQTWLKETADKNARCSNYLAGEMRTKYFDAHAEVEAAHDVIGSVGCAGLGSAVLHSIHKVFYSRLGVEDSLSGAWRQVNGRVQKHIPPEWTSLPKFLAHADEIYLKKWNSLEEFLIVIAAAHHRLQWIRPFDDGNGRAIRLQSQLALRPLGSYFWSLSGGLWMRKTEYFAKLEEADSSQQSDLDEGGALSQKRLVEWCEFFIDVCHQEIRRNISRL